MIHGGDIVGFSEKYGQRPIDFSANVSPLGLPEGIKKAILDNIDDISVYPDPLCRELRENIAKFHGKDIKNIICGNGAADLIFRLVYARKPKKALILAPTFAEYEQALESVSCDINYYYLKKESKFNICDDFLMQIDDSLDIIFICQPNNPTGVIAEKEFMLKILKKCEEKGVLLVIDECFIDFIANFEEFTLENTQSRNLFILKAFTKMYALAGARIGYGFSFDDELLHEMSINAQPWSVSYVAQIAGISAIKEIEYVKKVLNLIQVERGFLQSEFSRLGIEYIESSVNYILFYTNCINFKEKIAANGILIRDCSNYKGLSLGYFRVAVRTRKENEKLINAFENVLTGGV